MKIRNEKARELSTETLDPQNWDDIHTLGHRMVDDMINFLQTIKEKPVWQQVPENVKTKFSETLPKEGLPLADVYNEFKENILPYYIGNIHPKFWGWVMGTGSVQGMLADMLASGMNSNVNIGDQSPMYVDRQVINWCKEMMNFSHESSGALVGGASVANLNALIVARNHADRYLRKYGLAGQQLVMYASTETHSCIQKAAEIIGIGSDGVRKVRVNDNYEMDTVHLEQLIEEDREEGRFPFCIVANVGTVNTGSIDPLDKIFWICCKQNLWMHIDGAFGALLKLLPEYQDRLNCLEFADSIAFDLHKWMYMPYEAGVVLIKDRQAHRDAFALQPDYIQTLDRGVSAGPELTSDYGFDLSRNFKALKVWMLLKENGIDKFSRLIRQNLQQAQYLGEKIAETPGLELVAPVFTNIVCFRYADGSLTNDSLNELNKELLIRLQEQGVGVPSGTVLNGKYCLRTAIVNHRSVKEDFDALVEASATIGFTLNQRFQPLKIA